MKEFREQEQQGQVRASRYHAPMANIRGIFEEGHRLVQAKMKIKVLVAIDEKEEEERGIPLNKKCLQENDETPPKKCRRRDCD